MNGYYSVFDPDGKKIADCGIERDAVNLMHSRNKYWDGHYFTFNPLPGDIIDVSVRISFDTNNNEYTRPPIRISHDNAVIVIASLIII